MKTLAKISAVVCAALLWAAGAVGQTNTTVVVFATQFFTGQALNNPIVVTSLNTPYSISNNLVSGLQAILYPTNGVAVTNLYPGDYGVVIQGDMRSWTLTVPLTTNVVNAAASPKAGVSGLNVWLWTNTIPFTVVVTQYVNLITLSSNQFDPIIWINVAHTQTNRWIWDTTNSMWYFNDGIEADTFGVPFQWAARGLATNTWSWDDPDAAFNFDGSLRAQNLELVQGLLVDNGATTQILTTDSNAHNWRFAGRDLFDTTFSGSSPFVKFLGASPNPTMTVLGPVTAVRFIVSGTTNQIIFGATNTAPLSTTAPTKWISVQVQGEATVYRLPLYQ